MSGVANMRKGIDSIAALRSAIKKGPRLIAEDSAKEVSAYLTDEIRSDFAAGRTVYDEARPKGRVGQRLSLVSGGALPVYPKPKSHKSRGIRKGTSRTNDGGAHVRDTLGFTAIGTIVRAKLGQRYAKYLVGKYRILPVSLPVAWRKSIATIISKHLDRWVASGKKWDEA